MSGNSAMSLRPSVIAFDVIETVFSLDTLRGRFELVGLPGTALETWFAQTLRGAFVLDATGAFVSSRDVATANLASMLLTGDEADSRIENDLAGFAELDDLDDALDQRFCDSCFRFRHNTLATGIQ